MLMNLVGPASGVLMAMVALAAAPAAKPVVGNCLVQIEGRRIERLTLQQEGGAMLEFKQPKGAVALPKGRYRIVQVDVQGGYRHVSRASSRDAEWFTAAPDKPCPIQIGAPLRPCVSARAGDMCLTIHCQLVDAAGRRYGGPRTNPPPSFTIYKDGQAIGSGTFEYG